jgi:chemotaxis protein CheY-P-specific phosphatase CheC
VELEDLGGVVLDGKMMGKMVDLEVVEHLQDLLQQEVTVQLIKDWVVELDLMLALDGAVAVVAVPVLQLELRMEKVMMEQLILLEMEVVEEICKVLLVILMLI